MKKFLITITLPLLLLGADTKANADTVCQPIYGGGQSCVTSTNLSINKKVQNPQDLSFVDNLGVNDPKYKPDQTVNFQITVTNTSGSTIGTVHVQDIFPQFVTFVSGPGNFDTNSKTLSFDLTNLASAESRTFSLQAKVVGSGLLPQDKGVVCVVNQATATNGGMATDNSQFCIEKGVPAPVTTKGGIPVMPAPTIAKTPATGPEMLSLIGLIPMAGAGLFLRKKASK